ncbi:DUF1338-domain-containing protein [Aspergillus costaricaensis CBS 115574]|uniref:DUF1338-domain-containing protein n=1 Tax=Aspergillus costaricaensis CBS 115574 TaxID=1448317 RepID=A0ACD1I7T8_9EURO|nr:DUF1338-domain-containing protein [Aspergillus costaricaensis CBS 115574]RAK86397.1 DUF1338-domain-containing protein [Aspergillus costaricaensis CBS 115574]
MTVSGMMCPDDLRAEFASALSDMYQDEVPQYGDLLDIVSTINHQNKDSPRRIEVERHGAIRLGTAEELNTMRRLFLIMGMEPVGFYDLTVAGLPIYATGFRPVREDSLARNPFRVFTSLLRLDLIEDPTLRAQATSILNQRNIFTDRCVELIEFLENRSTIPTNLGQELIREALETFRWHRTTTVDLATYQALHAQHALVADIVCFRGPHINHLTPRVVDIDAAHKAMQDQGLQVKSSIEGPPPRRVPILLRQTSFLALEEDIDFGNGRDKGGKHRARFGEIEQRGIALTPEGRKLYDRLLNEYLEIVEKASAKGTQFDAQEILADVFQQFPDDLSMIREKGLAYFKYEATEAAPASLNSRNINMLVYSGHFNFTPIVYEDFLPASAAGIFLSNLQRESCARESPPTSDRGKFEKSLGCVVHDEFAMYAKIEEMSIAESLSKLFP